MRVAGVDEAGRGPLAGPVAAAAVILPPEPGLTGLGDSKRLSQNRRELLEHQIKARAIAWSVVMVEAAEIDRLNILQATLLAMRRAVAALAPAAESAMVDGNHLPELPIPATAIVGGDATEPAISAASILAKVARDRYMLTLHERHPEYGFDRHKGYPTADHMRVLADLGPCPEHRCSFAPVRAAQIS